MNKIERAKKLGFKDVDEMLLYHDVCSSVLVIPECPSESNDQDKLDNLWASLLIDTDYTKEDLEKSIDNNGLRELFNKVKGMSLFNRMIEIYIYNANNLSLSTKMKKIFESKLNNARESSDAEKEQEYRSKLDELTALEYQSIHAIHYIMDQVSTRLPLEKLSFYETVDNATKNMKENLLETGSYINDNDTQNKL